ncbi:MAG: nitrilase-related carbon-nitrogen hydrolase, partial [Paracoccaceae bacterium]
MKLALWQGPSPAGDVDAAYAALSAALIASAAIGAKMLVAPEVYLPGYNHDHIPAFAQPRGGAWHKTLAQMTRTARCGLTVGYAERDGDAVYN